VVVGAAVTMKAVEKAVVQEAIVTLHLNH